MGTGTVQWNWWSLMCTKMTKRAQSSDSEVSVCRAVEPMDTYFGADFRFGVQALIINTRELSGMESHMVKGKDKNILQMSIGLLPICRSQEQRSVFCCKKQIHILLVGSKSFFRKAVLKCHETKKRKQSPVTPKRSLDNHEKDDNKANIQVPDLSPPGFSRKTPTKQKQSPSKNQNWKRFLCT